MMSMTSTKFVTSEISAIPPKAAISKTSNSNYSKNIWSISSCFKAIELIVSANLVEKTYIKKPLTAASLKK